MSGETASNQMDAPSRLLIRASAGTGKTYQLSTRYLAALQQSTPDRILATTFTRKAAGEILQRVLTRLAAAVLDSEPRQELAAALSQPELSSADSGEQLQQMVRSLHRVRIGTLDSFFAQVARAFALELGLPPNWRVLDEGLVEELQRRAIQDVVQTGGTSDIRRLAHLVAKGAAKRSVNALILSAVETHYKLYRLVAADAWSLDVPAGLLSDIEVETTVEELRQAPLSDDSRWDNARRKDVERALNAQWESFVASGLAAKVADGEFHYHGKKIDPSVVVLYQRLLTHAAAACTITLRHQNEATRDLLERFDTSFGRIKQNAGVLTFSDVTHRIAEVISEEDAAHLAYRLDAQVDHLLLDEFQDTSPEQWQVLRPIARGLSRDSASTFFCVGDVKQAIYGWRGGEAAIFDAVATQVEGIQQQPLNRSYRSAPVVIDAVNRVFQNLGGYPDLGKDAQVVQRFSRDFPPHSTVLREATGYVTLRTACAGNEDEDTKEPTLRFAADQIKELVGRFPPDVTVGVLMRTNKSAGKLIYDLQTRGISASGEGGTPVTDSAAVQLVLSALQFADHPGDTVARYHVAHSPLSSVLELTAGIDDLTAQHLAQDLRGELLERGYGDVLYDWMLALHASCDERELTRLRELVGLADEFDPFESLRPSDFVRYVRRRRVEDPRSSQVRVMTIHRSKGLEFDAVILPELDGKLFQNMDVATLQHAEDPTAPPVLISRPANANLRKLLPGVLSEAVRQTRDRMTVEALCLLYVAMTRAAHGLYMYVAPETQNYLAPSRLLRHTLGASEVSKPEEVLYEHGEADWFHTIGDERETPLEARPPEPMRVELAAMEAGRTRGLESVAPSRHQDAARRLIRISNVLAPGRPRALRSGTIVHAWFESVEWLEDGVPNDEELLRLARRLGAADADAEELLVRFRTTLEAPAITHLLCRANYENTDNMPLSEELRSGLGAGPIIPEVRNECPIATLADGLLVAGTIDRLVLLSVEGRVQVAEVIDFKTDPVEPGQTGRLVQKYGDQLRTYADAVARMYDLPRERIATRLVSSSAACVLDVPAEVSVERPPGGQLTLF